MCRNVKIRSVLLQYNLYGSSSRLFFADTPSNNLVMLFTVNLSFSVFADRCRCHLAAQHVRHKLRTVADSKHGHTQFQTLPLITKWELFARIRCLGPPVKIIPLGCISFMLVQRIRLYGCTSQYTLHSLHSAGNQLVILTAEIENHNHFSIQLSYHAFRNSLLNICFPL